MDDDELNISVSNDTIGNYELWVCLHGNDCTKNS